VLVGLAGSGKTTFRDRHPEWAIVSRDDIRRSVFHCDFDAAYEDAVTKIFAAMLVEIVESPAEVVCVDNTNLTRAERQELIEVARASDRRPIAYVMPSAPLDFLYERKLHQLEVLAADNPEIVVGGFPRERYVMTSRMTMRSLQRTTLTVHQQWSFRAVKTSVFVCTACHPDTSSRH